MVATPETDFCVVFAVLCTERPRMLLIVNVVSVINVRSSTDAYFKHKVDIVERSDNVVRNEHLKIEAAWWVESSGGNHAPIFL